MKHKHPFIAFLLLLLAVTPCAAQEKEAAKPEDYLAAAEGAAAWIATLAEEADPDVPGLGTQWQTANDLATPVSMNSLYGGGAGIVLFHINLYKATGKENYKSVALSGAQGLLARATVRTGAHGRGFTWLEQEVAADGKQYTFSKPSLYGGGAGIGWLFLQAHREFKLAEYLVAAKTAANGVMDAAVVKDGKASFEGGWTDILSGNAGILLFFLDLHEAGGDAAHLEFAKQCAAWLQSVRRGDATSGYFWRTIEGDEAEQKVSPNFSNGVAGVGYAMLRMFEATGDEAYLASARGAARWLQGKAQDSKTGCKWCQYYDPKDADGQKIFRTGWCHGPAGTSRFFRKLSSLVNNEAERAEWQSLAVRAEAYLDEAARPDSSTPISKGYSRCCGAAALGMYWLRYRDEAGGDAFRASARAFADQLLSRADRGVSGACRWLDDPAPSPDGKRIYPTSYMMGAAGIGDFLLHEYVAAAGKHVILLDLPDTK